MKTKNLFLAGIAVLLFAGCATEYTPDISQTFDPIKEFSSKNSINLINGQPSNEQEFFFRKYYADLNHWTDLAIQIANRELTKRGLTVKPDATKSLTMSITGAKTKVGWVMINSDVLMTVRASNGYTATYDGNDFSAMVGNPRSEMDTALMKVVAAMLNDPQIVSFLTK